MTVDRRNWLKTLVGVFALPLAGAASDSSTKLVTDDHIRELAQNAPLAMRFRGSTAEECRAWQKRFRDKLAELLGPHRPPTEWQTVAHEVAEFEDHRRESLVLKAPGHPALPLYVLTPKGPAGKRPGVLALHGHGPFGNDAVVGIDTTPERVKNIRDLNYDYGRQLVRQGYVVVAPCFAPFGQRLGNKEAYDGNDACAVSFVRMQLLGKVLMAENLRDALWAFELLARNKNVDSDRLGCVGLSYGGRMTMLTTAMESRIRVAVVSGALNVMQERIGKRYSCGAQVIPGLLEYGDIPEIASLIAPRPALWEVGQKDGLMVKEWIPRSWQNIQKAYVAIGAERNLAMDSFDGSHRWNGVEAYPFLARAILPASDATRQRLLK